MDGGLGLLSLDFLSQGVICLGDILGGFLLLAAVASCEGEVGVDGSSLRLRTRLVVFSLRTEPLCIAQFIVRALQVGGGIALSGTAFVGLLHHDVGLGELVCRLWAFDGASGCGEADQCPCCQ